VSRPRTPEHRRKHGDENGYKMHKDRGEQPCPSCYAGHREYARLRRVRRNKQRQLISSILAGQSKITKITWDEYDLVMKTLKEDLDR
jgi:hypothetical protein